MKPGLHPRETDRLAALHALHIVDETPIAELDAAARLAAVIGDVPFGSINLIDRDRHVTAASFGAPPIHAPREMSLCAMAILEGGLVYTADAQYDERFRDKPVMKLINPPIRMFAAAPINTSEGLPIGTVRVYGPRPCRLSVPRQEALVDLADQVMRLLEWRRTASQLKHFAMHDELTGLPNRRALAIQVGPTVDTAVSVFSVDLDGFKAINDTYGHHVGDEVLRTVARRLTGVVGHSDIVARMGGDEFVIWCAGGVDTADLRARIAYTLSIPIDVEGQQIIATASVGSVSVTVGTARDEALRQVDRDMYTRKPGRRLIS